ncbi:hypothetical protein Tco_0152155 [Tanacetum coccineum]
MTSVHNSSGLAPPRQMTSDHNSSELGIHDHSNELSSSKLVPKVVPPADKTATSRQELELLFHHHITMLSCKPPQKGAFGTGSLSPTRVSWVFTQDRGAFAVVSAKQGACGLAGSQPPRVHFGFLEAANGAFCLGYSSSGCVCSG